ncbi:methylated-DNA--[protein]-cysteine S-methyltransferase [bacterium]|nr:methylated-DNA--[protein]-cysteine S-methyltransferase [bacterium]
MIYFTRFDSLFCEIILVGNDKGLTHLHLNTGEGKREFEINSSWIRNDVFFGDTIKQIQAYFDGTRRQFDIRLNPQGTEFQKSVWRKLIQIPYGTLHTYKEIAKALGNDRAGRAVGLATSKNPIPLIIPCHRVIGTNGKLTGFAHGLAIKEKLIHFEKENDTFKSDAEE